MKFTLAIASSALVVTSFVEATPQVTPKQKQCLDCYNKAFTDYPDPNNTAPCPSVVAFLKATNDCAAQPYCDGTDEGRSPGGVFWEAVTKNNEGYFYARNCRLGIDSTYFYGKEFCENKINNIPTEDPTGLLKDCDFAELAATILRHTRVMCSDATLKPLTETKIQPFFELFKECPDIAKVKYHYGQITGEQIEGAADSDDTKEENTQKSDSFPTTTDVSGASSVVLSTGALAIAGFMLGHK